MSVVAVDWSGRRTGEARHLWMAEAVDGQLLALDAGRTREQVVDELVDARRRRGTRRRRLRLLVLPPRLVPGRAGAPWRPRPLGGRGRRRRTPGCVSARPPFWGGADVRDPQAGSSSAAPRPASPRSAGSARSRRSRSAGRAASAPVRSAASRSSPAAATAGFTIWPFDEPAVAPVAVEIYPRALTGAVVEVATPPPGSRTSVSTFLVSRLAHRDARGRERGRVRRRGLRAGDVAPRSRAPIAPPGRGSVRAPRRLGVGARRRVSVQPDGVARCRRVTDGTIAGCNMAEMSVSDVHE